MWTVKLEDDARKAFKRLDKRLQSQILAKLRELEQAPDPGVFAKPLMYDLKGLWRLRVGSHRVIFRMNNAVLLILVIDIGRRDSVYD